MGPLQDLPSKTATAKINQEAGVMGLLLSILKALVLGGSVQLMA